MKKIKAKQLLEPIIIIPKERKICNNKNINIFNSDSLDLIKAWINKLCVYDVKYNNRKEYAIKIHNNIYEFVDRFGLPKFPCWIEISQHYPPNICENNWTNILSCDKKTRQTKLYIRIRDETGKFIVFKNEKVNLHKSRSKHTNTQTHKRQKRLLELWF